MLTSRRVINVFKMRHFTCKIAVAVKLPDHWLHKILPAVFLRTRNMSSCPLSTFKT